MHYLVVEDDLIKIKQLKVISLDPVSYYLLVYILTSQKGTT